jgi:hypothetical protein
MTSTASFLEGDAPSAPKLQARSAVCALAVPSHDQRREEDLPIERCASGGPIRQGLLRREGGTTRRSSLHWVFDGRCRADCAIGVPPRSRRSADVPVGMEGNIQRRLAGPSRKSVGDRAANPTLRNQRMALCEVGSGIYRRLGPVLNLRA